MLANDPLAPVLRALQRDDASTSDYDLNPELNRASGRVLRPAAVLVGFLEGVQGPEVLLTKRSSRLKHHPGQIAFPGGKVDPSDASPEETALREAREEVGLDPASVEILGRLPTHETVTSFAMTPVLGRITRPFTPVPEAGEVADVFTVPLHYLADLSRYRTERRLWLGQWRSYHVVPVGPYYIWGATARVLMKLAQRMAP